MIWEQEGKDIKKNSKKAGRTGRGKALQRQGIVDKGSELLGKKGKDKEGQEEREGKVKQERKSEGREV